MNLYGLKSNNKTLTVVFFLVHVHTKQDLKSVNFLRAKTF